MNILNWNVRGLMAPERHRMVKRHLEKVACDIIMFQETKCCTTDGERFVNHCRGWMGTFQNAEGPSGGLGILWNPNTINVSGVNKSKNWISCQIQSKLNTSSFLLWSIYGPSHTVEKTKLWEDLNQQIRQSGTKKFIVEGDFNEIMDLSEKNRGMSIISRDMLDFREFVQKIEAVDCIPSEGWFKWTNRRMGFTNITE
ncbi:uncharacterized protein LOC131874170 [Cryptomeria japonica]|uniref:uncharacterized protein LOC131874170 n=1 Tax=Cryptomeria japonica TaxID=3369 RepID=UPI0027DA2AD7|nr:uncharacterized protein LOC131874170 [Cryptomeria japonica]